MQSRTYFDRNGAGDRARVIKQLIQRQWHLDSVGLGNCRMAQEIRRELNEQLLIQSAALANANFNPDELRDQYGQWTTDGGILAQISNPAIGGQQHSQHVTAGPRPSSAVFWSAYPNYDKYRQQDIWQNVIGGSLGQAAGPEKNPPTGLNSCATRVSRALNYSGSANEIPKGTHGAWVNHKSPKYHDVQGDEKRYIVSAGDMNNYLRKTWGNPDKTLKTEQQIKDYINSLPEGQCAVFATRSARPGGQGHSGVLKKGYDDPYVLDEVQDGPIDVWLLPK